MLSFHYDVPPEFNDFISIVLADPMQELLPLFLLALGMQFFMQVKDLNVLSVH